MVLITASCTMLCTSAIVLQALSLSYLIPSIYLSLPPYNHKVFELGHVATWAQDGLEELSHNEGQEGQW